MEESIPVRYTFIMLLAVADQEGCVIGTDVALARRLNIPFDEFRHCVEQLGKPDPDSNSKELDGVRLVKSDGERGYQIVNYVKYRNIKGQDDKREYMRNYMRERRKSQQNNGFVKPVNFPLTVLADVTHTEAATATDTDTKDIPATATPPPLKKKKTLPAGEKNPGHKLFADGWCESYEREFGVKYPFDGSKDGKAIKELLEEFSFSVPEMLSVAQKAWRKRSDKFSQAGRRSGSIHDFRHAYSAISTEVMVSSGGSASVLTSGYRIEEDENIAVNPVTLSRKGETMTHDEVYGSNDRRRTPEQLANRELYQKNMAERRAQKEREQFEREAPAKAAAAKDLEERLARQEQAARDLEAERA